MEYKEDMLTQEQELRDEPLFDLLRGNRPQPPRESRAQVRRTLDRIETPFFARLGAFARRAPVAFAAACLAVALLLSGTAYAVASWIHRDDYKPGDYLDTPPEQRAEASAIPEVEQVVQNAAPKSEGVRVVMLPEMADADTLDQEYRRDLEAGKPIHVPEHYYPDDDPGQAPLVSWRAHANLLFCNWLNYFVYQTTPYDLSMIPSGISTEDVQE